MERSETERAVCFLMAIGSLDLDGALARLNVDGDPDGAAHDLLVRSGLLEATE